MFTLKELKSLELKYSASKSYKKLKDVENRISDKISFIREILVNEREYHKLMPFAQQELLENCVDALSQNDSEPLEKTVIDELYVYMQDAYDDQRS